MEGVKAIMAGAIKDIHTAWEQGRIAVAADPQWRLLEQLRPKVVVDAILPGSGAEKELQTGDVITAIGEAAISDMESLRRQLISAEPNQALAVTFRRDDMQQKAEISPTSISGTC